MKTLTKILGVVAVAGALTAIAGYKWKDNITFAVGATGTALCSVGYILAKSKEDEQNTYTKRR